MTRKMFLGALMSCFVAVFAMGLPSVAQADVAEDVAAAMANNPDGGPALAEAIEDIVKNADDPATAAQEVLDAVAGLSLNAAQLSAIGTGVGQAANIVGLTDPGLFARIARVIAGSSEPVQIAFDIVTGTPTAAIDPTVGPIIRGPGSGGGTVSES